MNIVNRASRLILFSIAAALIVAAAGVVTSSAQQQQPQPPNASEFLANPNQLLQQNANGGSLLANTVQQLAISDPSTFKVLLGLLATANDLQKRAIGQGLAQAAKIEVLTNQATAADWQQQIAAVTDPVFKTAAIDAFGDVQLGAIGGGPLGAVGSGLGGPGSGPTSGPPQAPVTQNTQPTAVTTQAFTTLSSSTSGASTSVSP